MRSAVAVIAVIAGLVLIAVPIGYSLFGRTADAERILDRFEFLTLGDNPARYLAEAVTTRAGSTELVEEAIPALAADAGIRDPAARFPAFADAQEKVPLAHEFSVRYSEQLDAVDGKFQSVYDIPVAGLPLTATPWLFLLGGIACLAAGVVALRAGGRGPLLAILVLGFAMVVVPLALGAAGKSADAEDVKDFASRGLSQRAADAAQTGSASLDALVAETSAETLPAIARRQGTTAAELEERVAGDFPAAARFLAEWDAIGPRLAHLADAVTVSVDEFESARRMPIAFPVWLLIGSGLAMGIAAAAGLALQGRRSPAPA